MIILEIVPPRQGTALQQAGCTTTPPHSTAAKRESNENARPSAQLGPAKLHEIESES